MEKTIKKQYVYKGKIFKIREDVVKLENNNHAIRNVVEHNGGCAILIYDKSTDEFYFVEQYRYAIEQSLVEIPAGKIEVDEDHVTTAYREAIEEVGVKPKKLEYWGYFYPTCGYSNEKIHLYFCDNFEKLNNLDLDEDEFLEPLKLKKDMAFDMIRDGLITDGKTLIALMLFKQKKQ